MSVQISECYNVYKRCLELDCAIPTGIAILPTNFDIAKSKKELHYSATTQTIRTIWRKEGITETRIEKESERFSFLDLNSFEWFGPTIFFSAQIISQYPDIIKMSLGVINVYLQEFFRGVTGEKKARLKIIVEEKDNTKYKEVNYEGDIEGMRDLPKIIGEING